MKGEIQMFEYLKIMALALLTIGPSLLWIGIIAKKQHAEINKNMVINLLVLGAILTNPVANIENFLKQFNPFLTNSVSWQVFDNFIRIALSEEAGKMLCFLMLTRNGKKLSNGYEAIIYAVAVSLGFAAMENVAFVYWRDHKFQTAIARALVCTTGHMSYAILMGTFYGMCCFKMPKFNLVKCIVLLASIVVPTIVHGLYDFALDMCGVEVAVGIKIAVCYISLMVANKAAKMMGTKSGTNSAAHTFVGYKSNLRDLDLFTQR